MTFSIRKNELDAIKAILTDESYADEDEMAKALIQGMMSELAKRESFVYVVQDGEFKFLWPFWYEKDAVRFAQANPPLAGTRQGILKAQSPVKTEEQVAAVAAEAHARTEGLNWQAESPQP